ncbi:MAG: MaoC/PaaZ C-terminal domain-containing protein [Dehalococcoidia bacterium]|jgi:acyl dehydratase|nr:MaoC/PaaZ C-terminal domain-containing protein [Dehalococcoidia bacterium]MDP6783039.1 MaoC/PaaZ C-terminal domain-containing protein [Dehalococcoidia bacterium]MDP7470300.1 MaoC/PaaZ C-terminal domain-containing protein [Dehalococcoidia bacterium]
MEGMHFEDVNIGDKFLSMGRTIFETDIVNFLGLSRINEPLFNDREFYEKQGILKGRLVPGPLTYVIAMGLFTNLGLIHGTVLAFLGMDEFRIPKPVFCGDTLTLELTVISKRQTSKPKQGVVTFRLTTRNQRNEEVMHWNHTLMLAGRGAA